jgi:hypothetical protein
MSPPTPVSFSNDDWVWGGVAQVGATYALGPRWFLDRGYTHARSPEFKIRDSASFLQQERTACEQRRRLPERTPAD